MRIGILLYDGVEPIDLGALGVFSIATRFEPTLTLCTISSTGKRQVRLAGGLCLVTDHLLDDAPRCDALVVAGGPTWETEIHRRETLAFLRARAADTLLAAACMGVMPLVAAGVLDGRQATLRNQTVGDEANPIDRVNRQWPAVSARVAHLVDQGRVVTGGGGILNVDLALHLLGRLYSRRLAEETARILEYREAFQANGARLGDITA